MGEISGLSGTKDVCVSSPKRDWIKKDQGICEVPTNLLKFHFAHKNIPKIIFDS
jgi:hypothetical protein